jgi:uncharacterized protein (TIRG00374 family)
VSYDLAAPRPGRSAGAVVRYVLGVLLGIAVLVLLLGKRGELAAVRQQFGHLDAGWVAAAVLAEGTSLAAFGVLQRRVLRLAGARLALPGLLALSLANDAIANTVPGEPVVSGAYRYRYYRRRGVDSAGAGWSVFTVVVAMAIGMSLFLLAGVAAAALASTTVRVTGLAVAGLALVLVASVVLIRRDLLLRLAAAGARAARRVTGHPRSGTLARIEAVLARMRDIPLSAPSAASVVTIAVCVWACDFLCLLCSFAAVHAAVPWDGVLLAYGAAQIVSSLPVVPGGLGIVEGSLAVLLAAYGIARGPAITAALAYRLVSFWLVIVVGWVSVGLIAYQGRRRPGHHRPPPIEIELPPRTTRSPRS